VIVVIMGVSGSGKSTVGRLLAQRLGWSYYEGDDYHGAANIEKMAKGIALTDEDRLPWLASIKALIHACGGAASDAVIACSALRRDYRRYLAADLEDVRFVYLKGPMQVIRQRMKTREDHYMKAVMLESQFASLEEPDDAIVADIAQSPEDIVARLAVEVRVAANVTPIDSR
jgi:gluconokinase